MTVPDNPLSRAHSSLGTDIHGNTAGNARLFKFEPKYTLSDTTAPSTDRAIENLPARPSSNRAEQMRELGKKIGNGFKKILAGICVGVGFLLSTVGLAVCHIVAVALSPLTVGTAALIGGNKLQAYKIGMLIGGPFSAPGAMAAAIGCGFLKAAQKLLEDATISEKTRSNVNTLCDGIISHAKGLIQLSE